MKQKTKKKISVKKEHLRQLLEPIGTVRWWQSMLSIVLGCSIMAFGYNFFFAPYNIVPGGVYGLGIVLHNIFPSIQVGTFGYMFDIPLLITAILVFGRQFGGRTLFAAVLTPGIMNILNYLAFPDRASLEHLDPAQMFGGVMNLSEHLMLASIMGAAIIGVGVGLVLRNQATTGGTDIVGMLLQKFAHLKFSSGILIADSCVVLSGLIVVGFGIGNNNADVEQGSWLLSLYSLVAIYITSRVLALVIDGASYDKILFVLTDKVNDIRDFIVDDLDRTGTIIKAKGMYNKDDKEMIFLVVNRREIVAVQRKIKDIDPKAFLVVADAYETYGEGFKDFAELDTVKASEV